MGIAYCFYSILPHKTCLLRTQHIFSGKTNMCKIRHIFLRTDPVQNSLLHMHWLHALPTNWHIKQTGMSMFYHHQWLEEYQNINSENVIIGISRVELLQLAWLKSQKKEERLFYVNIFWNANVLHPIWAYFHFNEAQNQNIHKFYKKMCL